jgi:hypothetical protein
MEGGLDVDVVLLRRVHPLRNAGLAIAGFGVGLGFALSGDARILWLAGLLFTGGLLVLLGIKGTTRRVAARLDALGVRIGDRFVARRRSFRAAWIEHDDERTWVHVHGVRPALRLEAKDVADAHRLLRLLGLDRSQTVLRLPSYWGGVWGQLFAQVVLQLAWQIRLFSDPGRLGWAATALWATFIVLLWLVTFLSLHGETVIGTDGLLFLRPFHRRFVAFSEIQSVDLDERSKLVVRTRSGTTFKRTMPAAAAQAALEAIESSLASVGSPPEALRQRLGRSTTDEDATAWLARVRALATSASYRADGLAADVLWRVVDDARASASERAGAAAALDVNATPDERQRLRDIAARMASPRVRVAIEHVAARRPLPPEGSASEPSSETALGPTHGDDELAAAMARITDA